MDFEKIRIELQKQFEKDPFNEDTIGRLASAYMEIRHFEEAYEILKYGAEKTPGIQTLSNLGYFYLYEGEPDDDRWLYQEEKAIAVLEKAVSLNPVSHVPYSVLGEAYLLKNQDCMAEFILKKAIEIEQTSTNLNNLGVALYRQNKFEEAEINFYNSHQKRKLKYYTFRPYINYGMSLAKQGMKKRAVEVAQDLINNREDKSFEVSLADIISIYYEIEDLNKVAELYPKAFEEIAISPQEFERYIFTLKELGQEDKMKNLYIDTIKSEEEFIKDIREDDEIDEECKRSQISDALDGISKYRNGYSRVVNGETIENYYDPFIEKDCYLFGCLRHKNPVYSEAINAIAAKGDFL